MSEQITVKPKIIDLQDTNDIYMTMNLRILSNEENYNRAIFLNDFIDNTVKNKDEYKGIPFLVNKEKLEEGNIEDLTHELDMKTGELGTDQIGSFVDFWKTEEDDGKVVLNGEVRIFKRFQSVCEKVIDLYSSGNLSTSCEVIVASYEEISEDGARSIGYSNGQNALIGSAIVSDPAMPDAKPTLLVAEAYEKDMQNSSKGGENLTKEYNNGIKIKYHGKIESSSVTFEEILDTVFNQINPVNSFTEERELNYFVWELYNDKAIVVDDYTGDFYSIGFTIDNNTNHIVVDSKNNWTRGSYQFVPEGIIINELIEDKTQEVETLEKEISNLKEEKKEMAQDNEKEIKDLEEKIAELEAEIEQLKEEKKDLESSVVAQKEETVTAQEKIEELNGKIEELAPYKEQVEKAEQEKAVAQLTDKFSKLMDKETFESEEVAQAIQDLDEGKLNSIVVSEVAKKAAETTKETASTIDEGIVVPSNKQMGTLPTKKDASYWASSSK